MAIKRKATKQTQFGLFRPPSSLTLEQKETKKQQSCEKPSPSREGTAPRTGRTPSPPRSVGFGRAGLGLGARAAGLPQRGALSVGESCIDDDLNSAGGRGLRLRGNPQPVGGAADATFLTETPSSFPFLKIRRATLKIAVVVGVA